MTKFEDAFLDLVHRVNDDPIKVFDDALTYVLCQLSTGEVKVAWEHNEEHNKAFADFTRAYLDYLAERTVQVLPRSILHPSRSGEPLLHDGLHLRHPCLRA